MAGTMAELNIWLGSHSQSIRPRFVIVSRGNKEDPPNEMAHPERQPSLLL
jgi:hypothetical protein